MFNLLKIFVTLLILTIIQSRSWGADANIQKIKDKYRSKLVSLRDPFVDQLPKQNTTSQENNVNTNIQNIRNRITQAVQDRLPQNTSRPVDETRPLPSFNVSGVVWNSDRPQAIINGQIVGVGDILNEAEIISIKKEGITVIHNNKSHIIIP